METLRLFHTGFEVIEKPDVRRGRSNADFGQGFYLSPDGEFSRRWARERRGLTTYLNAYELDTSGLRIKTLTRDAEWFRYISANRAGRADALAEYDVITGPIANDTIYDTWGVITSGLVSEDTALRMLKAGNEYTQTVIKTEKAAARLRFTGASALDPELISGYRETVRAEERAFQEEFMKLLGDMTELN